MANTTNFGWETPDDTDLVKDGAAAMRTLGNSIDASFVDLKGGTSGQILSKNSNTDLDYVWINNDQGDITAVTAGTGLTGGGTAGAVTLTNDMATTITAAGDIVVGTGSGTYDNLPIGTTGQVLTADTTVSPYKVKWADGVTPPSYSLINAGGTALTGAATITVSGISGKNSLFIIIENASSASANSNFYIRFNGDSSNSYAYYNGVVIQGSNTNDVLTSGNKIYFGAIAGNAASTISGYLMADGCNSSGMKVVEHTTASTAGGATNPQFNSGGGLYGGTGTISSVSFVSDTGNWDAGTVYVYGA